MPWIFLWIIFVFGLSSGEASEETMIYSSDHKRLPGLFDQNYHQVALNIEEKELPYEIIWSFKYGKLFALQKMELDLPQVAEVHLTVSLNVTEDNQQFQIVHSLSGRQGPKIRLAFTQNTRFVKITFHKPITLTEITCFGEIKKEPIPKQNLFPALKKTIWEYPPHFRENTEKTLFEDLQDDQLQKFSLLDCSLIASGIFRSEDREEYHRRLKEWCTRFRVRYKVESLSSLELARLLLKELHGPQSWLGRYEKSSSDFQSLLEQKQFNCVSSLLLYQWVAKQFQLEILIAEGIDHTFGYLLTEQGQYPVETTSAKGFDLRSALSAQEEFHQHRGFQPYATNEQIRWVNDFRGVAMIYYNSGVEAERSKDYQQAIDAYKSALLIDNGFQAAYQNMLSATTKWISQQLTAKKFRTVLKRFPEFEMLFPHSLILTQYEVLSLNNYALHLLSQKEYKKSLNVFQKGLARFPENIYFLINHDLAIGSLAQELSYLEAEPLLNASPVQTLWLKHIRQKLYYQWAEEALKKQNFQEAVRFYREILQHSKTDLRLQQNLLFAYDQWARQEVQAGNLQKAFLMYHQVYQEIQDPDFLHNRNVLLTKIVLQWCEQKKFTEALLFCKQLLSPSEKADEFLSQEIAYILWKSHERYLELEAWPQVEEQIQQLDQLPLTEVSFQELEQQLILTYIKALTQQKKFSQAIEFLQVYLPHPLYQKQLIYLYYEWAELYGKKGMYQKACEVYQKALKHLPEEPTLINNLRYYEQKLQE